MEKVACPLFLLLKRIITVMSIFAFQFAVLVHGEDASNYLITNNIGSFLVSSDPSIGKGPGTLAVTDHFYQDHTDMTYEIDYFNLQTKAGPEVQITQHFGGDSDKWLLHEVEDGYRDGDNSDGRLGLLSGAGVKIREISGNRFFYWGLGGGSYTWISGQMVVEIKYTDLQRTKPEPIEVIQAYLQKFPSTIPTTLVLDKAHDEQWIKDEMDRRLWLCDKWFEQLQLGKVQQSEALQEVVKSMNIFLDYREKYYGVKAMDEKNTLQGYLDAKDETNIRNKLTEYKTWWSANKSGSFIGVLSIYIHKTFNYVTSFFKKVFVFLTSLVQKLFEGRRKEEEKGTGYFLRVE